MVEGKKKSTESKADKLRRLAEKRVPRALTAIRLVGNLGKYAPTSQQAGVIIKTLDEAVRATQIELQRTGGSPRGEFKLP